MPHHGGIGGYHRLHQANRPLTPVWFRRLSLLLAKIARIAHESGALVLLGDYQDSATRPVNVKTMDLDFCLCGTVKYLLGPPRLFLMYVRKVLTLLLVPSNTDWVGQANPSAFDVHCLEPSPNSRRFQAGTTPPPPMYGTSVGVRVLLCAGVAKIAVHGRNFRATLLKATTDCAGFAKTPADSVGPLMVLNTHSADAVMKTLAGNEFVVCNRLDGMRISFHLYNALGDVRAVLKLLEKNLDLLVTSKQLSTTSSKQ